MTALVSEWVEVRVQRFSEQLEFVGARLSNLTRKVLKETLHRRSRSDLDV
ncbi:hypothetical protein MK489_17320 [Myxococcota bacterium]|nr:hypothetical protein [Myxococcota bacterium]